MHTPTLLPLETFRKEVFPINPWHFWGFSNATVPVTSNCNTVLRKYGWQMADQAGRESLLEGILSAEARLFDVLDFWPAPKYTEKLLNFPRYPNPKIGMVGYAGADGRWQSLDVEERLIQSVGVQTRTLIEAGVAVTREDKDLDSLKEYFSLSVATTVTNPDQIAVYFSAADRFDGSDVSEEWRVVPVTVKIAGGTATISGPSWILGTPLLYEGVAVTNLDPGDNDSFVGTLDVYRLYIDPTGTTAATAQAKLTWESAPHPYFDGGQDPSNPSRDPAAIADKAARVALRDQEEGLLAPAEAVYDATSGIWTSPEYVSYRVPDHVTIRLFAGHPLQNGNMHPTMAKVVARLAAAETSQRVIACEAAQRDFSRWQRDLSRTTGPDQWGAINMEDLINPFGTLLGHVDAWKQAKQFRVLKGLAIGAI